MDAGDPNLNPQACTAIVLPSKASLQPPDPFTLHVVYSYM